MKRRPLINTIANILNISGFFGSIIIFIVLNNTDIGLLFSHPFCKTHHLFDVFFYVVPVYFIVLIIVNLKAVKTENKENQKTMKKLRIFISVFIFIESEILLNAIPGLYTKYLIKLDTPDAASSYIVEDRRLGNSGVIIIKKPKSIFLSERCSNSVLLYKYLDSFEVSWINNDSFNIILFEESAAEKYYFSYTAPDKLEAITKEVYESCKYIKTDKE